MKKEKGEMKKEEWILETFLYICSMQRECTNEVVY